MHGRPTRWDRDGSPPREARGRRTLPDRLTAPAALLVILGLSLLLWGLLGVGFTWLAG